MASVYKRGDTWWVRFRWENEHIRKSAKTKKKADAEAYLVKLMDEYSKKTRGSAITRYRVADAMERFFQEATLKKGTLRTYGSNRVNCNRVLGDLYLDEIDRKKLADFVTTRKRVGVSDATIRRDLSFLGSVFSMAIVWGWVDTNPVTALSKRSLKESRPRTRFLTRAEFERLHANASLDLRPQVMLAVETGMRKEELLGLTVQAIDLRQREIHLEKTKTNSPRRVPLSDKALATIKEILGNPNRPHSPYLFCKVDGSRVLDNKKGFRSACRRAGIADFRFHDLRHTFASWWVQNGGDLYKLSRVLGHKTLQMSARYGHLRTDDLHEEMTRVTQRRSQDRQIVPENGVPHPA